MSTYIQRKRKLYELNCDHQQTNMNDWCWQMLARNFFVISPQIRKFLDSSRYHKFLRCASPQITNPQFFMFNPQIANPQIFRQKTARMTHFL
jgi:hypothetical protein